MSLLFLLIASDRPILFASFHLGYVKMLMTKKERKVWRSDLLFLFSALLRISPPVRLSSFSFLFLSSAASFVGFSHHSSFFPLGFSKHQTPSSCFRQVGGASSSFFLVCFPLWRDYIIPCLFPLLWNRSEFTCSVVKTFRPSLFLFPGKYCVSIIYYPHLWHRWRDPPSYKYSEDHHFSISLPLSSLFPPSLRPSYFDLVFFSFTRPHPSCQHFFDPPYM